MRRTRRNHAAVFKANVALAALKGNKTLAELAQDFDLHANQIVEWKQQMQERAAEVFGAFCGPARPRIAPPGPPRMEHAFPFRFRSRLESQNGHG